MYMCILCLSCMIYVFTTTLNSTYMYVNMWGKQQLEHQHLELETKLHHPTPHLNTPDTVTPPHVAGTPTSKNKHTKTPPTNRAGEQLRDVSPTDNTAETRQQGGVTGSIDYSSSTSDCGDCRIYILARARALMRAGGRAVASAVAACCFPAKPARDPVIYLIAAFVI